MPSLRQTRLKQHCARGCCCVRGRGNESIRADCTCCVFVVLPRSIVLWLSKAVWFAFCPHAISQFVCGFNLLLNTLWFGLLYAPCHGRVLLWVPLSVSVRVEAHRAGTDATNAEWCRQRRFRQPCARLHAQEPSETP